MSRSERVATIKRAAAKVRLERPGSPPLALFCFLSAELFLVFAVFRFFCGAADGPSAVVRTAHVLLVAPVEYWWPRIRAGRDEMIEVHSRERKREQAGAARDSRCFVVFFISLAYIPTPIYESPACVAPPRLPNMRLLAILCIRANYSAFFCDRMIHECLLSFRSINLRG